MSKKRTTNFLSSMLLFLIIAFATNCGDDEEVLTCSQCSDSAKWSTGIGGACYDTKANCEDDTGKTCQICS